MNRIDEARARTLSGWCDDLDIEFLASVIKPEALPLARAAEMDRYKIASRTVTEHPDLVEDLLDEGKETFVSLGFWEEDDWPFGPPDDQLRYIYCVSEYPTYPEDLDGFPEAFGPDAYYGYSDHTHGIGAPLLAISRGARYVETHFTLDKTDDAIHDHILSTTPDEFETMVEKGREVARIREAAGGARSGARKGP